MVSEHPSIADTRYNTLGTIPIFQYVGVPEESENGFASLLISYDEHNTLFWNDTALPANWAVIPDLILAQGQISF